jgi:hypothetical protein
MLRRGGFAKQFRLSLVLRIMSIAVTFTVDTVARGCERLIPLPVALMSDLKTKFRVQERMGHDSDY